MVPRIVVTSWGRIVPSFICAQLINLILKVKSNRLTDANEDFEVRKTLRSYGNDRVTLTISSQGNSII